MATSAAVVQGPEGTPCGCGPGAAQEALLAAPGDPHLSTRPQATPSKSRWGAGGRPRTDR